MNLQITIPDEQRDRMCEALHYSEEILVDSGELDAQKQPIMAKAKISKEDFVFNYIAGLVNGYALNQKKVATREQVIADVVDKVQLAEPIEAKIPEATADAIDEAVAAATTIKPAKP